MTSNQLFDVALDFALEVIGDAPRQMRGVAMNEQNIAFQQIHCAASRLVCDEMRNATDGNFYACADACLIGQFCNAAFDPALMADQKALNFTVRQTGGDGDTQTFAASFNAQGQTFGARVFKHAQRQFTSRDRMNAFASNCRRLFSLR
ncbi:hypothetical protein D9M72_575840 [compost metagenome]